MSIQLRITPLQPGGKDDDKFKDDDVERRVAFRSYFLGSGGSVRRVFGFRDSQGYQHPFLWMVGSADLRYRDVGAFQHHCLSGIVPNHAQDQSGWREHADGHDAGGINGGSPDHRTHGLVSATKPEF